MPALNSTTRPSQAQSSRTLPSASTGGYREHISSLCAQRILIKLEAVTRPTVATLQLLNGSEGDPEMLDRYLQQSIDDESVVTYARTRMGTTAT